METLGDTQDLFLLVSEGFAGAIGLLLPMKRKILMAEVIDEDGASSNEDLGGNTRRAQQVRHDVQQNHIDEERGEVDHGESAEVQPDVSGDAEYQLSVYEEHGNERDDPSRCKHHGRGNEPAVQQVEGNKQQSAENGV